MCPCKGGIVPVPEYPGFERFMLCLGFETDLEWANESYQSPKGKIASNWKMTAEEIYYTVSIPTNSMAIVELPSNDLTITESGKLISDNKAIQKIDSRKFLIPSGKCIF
jgi:alpha-L-rhamnosidase